MIEMLLAKGLPMLADLAISKGEQYVKGLVKDKFGVDLEQSTDIPASHIEQLQHYDLELELMKEENHHEESILKTQTADVQDAREMYKSNIKDKNRAGEYFMYFITVLVVVGAGSALIFDAGMNDSVREFLKPLVTAAVFFWLGSSHGSKQKDEQKHEQQMAKLEQDDGELF